METIRIEIEKYEGPLDLLLTLITKHKIDIFDIPIAEIADQYMVQLEIMRGQNMDIAAEFIRMAAELMLIKSKMLLPKTEDEEDPRKPLVDALLEYQKAKEASEFLKERAAKYYDRFVRQPEELDLPYLRPHDKEMLVEAFERIYNRISEKPKQKNELFESISNKREYSVEEKTVWLLKRLYRRGVADFDTLFFEMNSVNEVCAAFLALLTLVAAGRVGIMRTGASVALILNKETKPVMDEPVSGNT